MAYFSVAPGDTYFKRKRTLVLALVNSLHFEYDALLREE